jgi:hypothetical protein
VLISVAVYLWQQQNQNKRGRQCNVKHLWPAKFNIKKKEKENEETEKARRQRREKKIVFLIYIYIQKKRNRHARK